MILRLLLILLLPCLVWARGNYYLGAVTTGCTTVAVDLTGEDYVSQLLNDSFNRKYVGTRYTGGSSFTICKSSIRMKEALGNVDSKTYYMAVYSLSGTALDTKVGQSDNVSGAVLSATVTDIEFTWSTPATLSTGYALVVTSDDAADASNYAVVMSNRALSSDWTFDKWDSNKYITATTYDANIKIWTQ